MWLQLVTSMAKSTVNFGFAIGPKPCGFGHTLARGPWLLFLAKSGCEPAIPSPEIDMNRRKTFSFKRPWITGCPSRFSKFPTALEPENAIS